MSTVESSSRTVLRKLEGSTSTGRSISKEWLSITGRFEFRWKRRSKREIKVSWADIYILYSSTAYRLLLFPSVIIFLLYQTFYGIFYIKRSRWLFAINWSNRSGNGTKEDIFYSVIWIIHFIILLFNIVEFSKKVQCQTSVSNQSLWARKACLARRGRKSWRSKASILKAKGLHRNSNLIIQAYALLCQVKWSANFINSRRQWFYLKLSLSLKLLKVLISASSMRGMIYW